MAEIPELEALARHLETHFKDKILHRLELTYTKKLNSYKQDFQQYVEGQRLHHVTRDGKTLLMKFRRGRVLGLNLMFSGLVKVVEQDEKTEFPIASFYFKEGGGFILFDQQKQASVSLDPIPSAIPDVLSKKFNSEYLENHLKNEISEIKKVLTNQLIVRGVGNSYADEILWQARISPFSVAKAIPKQKVQMLYQSMQEIFNLDITSFAELVKSGSTANILDFHKIHNPEKIFSPSGAKIMINESGPRKTYFTEEQELFK
ncbi:MAG: formamidopyrimidine-DNA glycosylase [Flavobacterium sp.]|nr:MAG: formamidopyrimidine-DNA glycosylase [Flavobacterium sp.]